MRLGNQLSGSMDVELTSADIAGALSAMSDAGIAAYHTAQQDDLTVRLTIRRGDFKTLARMAERRGENLRVLGRYGLYWLVKGLLGRPVLLVGMAILLVLVTFLPTRVLFVQVEGNVNIPSKLILEQAELCGIGFGASRREVRSEKMKNALLGAIPELQWAGINTAGCVATISVTERSQMEQEAEKPGVSSIVAAQDGIIREFTVLKGNGLCRVGQAVQAGQVLVSGYTDCGICIQATRAEAEIYAETQRSVTAVTPDAGTVRGERVRQEKKYGVLIGKKRINFYQDSRILDGSCVKMYSESYLTLPGGLQLPVAIVEEVWTYYDRWTGNASQEQAQAVLQRFSEQYLPSQMVAGRVLSWNETVSQVPGGFQLNGQYACLEMIGREQSEEIIKSDGESD